MFIGYNVNVVTKEQPLQGFDTDIVRLAQLSYPGAPDDILEQLGKN